MIFKIVKHLVFLFTLALITACGPGRSVSDTHSPQPEWVRSRPLNPGFYTGIGWAQKGTNINQYQQAARQNALADLAGEISVTISSNSVIHAFESNLGFREDFSSTVRASTHEDLEGYQIVDTWEDRNNYWVYYRLSIAGYNQSKERRKNDAVNRSLRLYQNALDAGNQSDLRMSIVHLAGSMEAIRKYLDEPLNAEFQGRDIQLGNEIFNELSSTISRITISPPGSGINIKRGQPLVPSQLVFGVTNSKGEPVTGFPLIASYSERPLRNNRVRTDNKGIAGFEIDAVRSTRQFETLHITADIETILEEATTDPVIRRLIRRFHFPVSELRINIDKPVLLLKSREDNIDEISERGRLAESFRRNAINSGYTVEEDCEDPDYVVEIYTKTGPAQGGGMYMNAILTGSITVTGQGGVPVYRRELEGFRGSHFDYERAGPEAYRQAERRMDSSFFREIDEAIRRVNPTR